jgi:hypothetical protein
VSATFVLCLIIAFAVADLGAAAATSNANALSGNPECNIAGASSWKSNACYGATSHYGVRASWHNASLWLDPALASQGHNVLQGLWSFTGQNCGQYWVEEGLAYRLSQGSTHYFYFVGAMDRVDGYRWEEVFADTPLNQPHTYEHRYVGWDGALEGTYSLRRDGIEYGLARFQGDGTCQSRIGVSSSLPPSGSYAIGTFDATGLAYCVVYPCGGTPIWQDWNVTTHWIDNPCGTPPTCFNGRYVPPGTTWWASNKPG